MVPSRAAALATCLALCWSSLTGAQYSSRLEDNGGHFRSANIYWEVVSNNTVKFTIESAWRRDYGSAYWKGSGADGLSVTGDLIFLNGRQWPIVSYGDTSMTSGDFVQLEVLAYSITNNWIFGRSILYHTYPSPNNQGLPWLVSFTGCCKLSEINNLIQQDAPWSVETNVDLLRYKQSPRLASMHLYSLPDASLPPPATKSVDFFIPGYHRNSQIQVNVSVAPDVLQDSPTNMTIATEGYGKVLVTFSEITYEESARNGKFYSIKVNGSTSDGIFVQADFLIRIQLNPLISMPKIAFGHTFLSNLPAGPNVSVFCQSAINQTCKYSPLSVGSMSGLQDPVHFWPDSSYHGYVGFLVNYTIIAQAPIISDRILFNVVGLPDFAQLTVTSGNNPAEMTTLWQPCAGQAGRFVICYEAASSNGNVSTPECVDVVVHNDTPPVFGPSTDADGDFDIQTVNLTQNVIVTMGATKFYTVHAYDMNCLDDIQINIDSPLPPGASAGESTRVSSIYGCQQQPNNHSLARTIQWLAPYNYGGYSTLICFAVSDACGGCNCAGVVDTQVQCVNFTVMKCKFSVSVEHEINEIAHIYSTSWLQIWKLNPTILHPDYILFKGQKLDIGRLLQVGPNDSLFAISQRYGASMQLLLELNRDINLTSSLTVGQDLCVLPDSCLGQAASIYAGVSEYRKYQCHDPGFNTDGVIFSSLDLCKLQCGGSGSCSSVSVWS
uniref:LysM domain-containing protein n=1 Tax=Hanusia phi TaxID=3032 RepID=A0A7S0EZF1_9CRYP|mmetsp:Transcript_3380/g.8172  ORF Transcript_3380/g.8172 Transcript_3380/m.8172 type:complete len:721 (+) Transcript_3380:111-2273(+)